jgi:hypothetical protein
MYVRSKMLSNLSIPFKSNNPHPTPVDLSSSWSLPSSVCALDPPSAMHSANLLGQNLILVRVREAPNLAENLAVAFIVEPVVRSVTLCFPCAVALRRALSAYKLRLSGIASVSR